MDLLIPEDAFSDGQVRSKLWLAESFNSWSQELFFHSTEELVLTWYGSWIGLGPFLMLSVSKLQFKVVNLVELDSVSLKTSEKILEYWRLKGLTINLIHGDMNQFEPETNSPNQVFVNTACEHDANTAWLNRLPKNSYAILQSTNMVHPEHINLALSLSDFSIQIENFLTVLKRDQIDFKYETKSFSRFMIFGKK